MQSYGRQFWGRNGQEKLGHSKTRWPTYFRVHRCTVLRPVRRVVGLFLTPSRHRTPFSRTHAVIPP